MHIAPMHIHAPPYSPKSQKIPLDNVQFVGYAFQVEMKYRAWKLGFKIKEVPITFIDRTEGTSKMSSNIVKEAMLGVWKMRNF